MASMTDRQAKCHMLHQALGGGWGGGGGGEPDIFIHTCTKAQAIFQNFEFQYFWSFSEK